MFSVHLQFKISCHLFLKTILYLFLIHFRLAHLKLCEVVFDLILGVRLVKSLENARLDGILDGQDHFLVLDHTTF